jgi:hypothetical protein
MPRLAGKQSNDGLLISLIVLTTIAVATGLEYTGAINLVPGFGKDNPTLDSTSSNAISEKSSVYQPIQK